MDNYRIAVLAGDGIGPEVMAVARRVLDAVAATAKIKLDLVEADVGGAAIDRHGEALPAETRTACDTSDAILFGSVGGPKWEHLPPAEQPERAALLPLRRRFQLFANLRPGILYPELTEASPLRPERLGNGLDILCVRELTGGLYFGQPKLQRELDDGDIEAIDTMVYRRSEIERIAAVAVAATRERGGRLCSVDKANVLQNSVLWRKTISEYVARHAPELELSHLYVDNAAMQLCLRPGQFDVIVTENMFGDILSDQLASICGSLGMLASASLGLGRNRFGRPFGLYEPSGGSAPDIAGKGIANPCAQILSVALMLRHSFGRDDLAKRIETAVHDTVSAGIRTGDIAFGGESVTTEAMGQAILDRLE